MSNKQPRLSIGLPVYNGEKFIRAVLDSLLAQTFTRIQFGLIQQKRERFCFLIGECYGSIHFLYGCCHRLYMSGYVAISAYIDS